MHNTLSYTIKQNARARHVKLRVTAHHGLEIIIPSRFNLKHIPQIIEINKQWIENAFSKTQLVCSDKIDNTLPTNIQLNALDETWTIQYIFMPQKKTKLLCLPNNTLLLSGKNDCPILHKKLLRQWIKIKAKAYLLEKLTTLSQENNLPYDQFNLRGQKTRWGSCNAAKSISLNYKLIFLPEHLVTHVILHELAHTIHLNHSAKFWQLLKTVDPNWQTHRRALRHASLHGWIPAWL